LAVNVVFVIFLIAAIPKVNVITQMVLVSGKKHQWLMTNDLAYSKTPMA